MNVCESLTVTANLVPNQTAIVFGDHRFSYRQLNELSIAAAVQLSNAGVQSGDRVALMLPNAPSFPVWYYATLRLGAIAVSINTRLAASEVEFMVNDCQAKVFIGSNQLDDLVVDSLPNCVTTKLSVNDVTAESADAPKTTPATSNNVWHDADPDDAALILYTSGTTGFPKGATLSHRNVRSNVCAFNHLCNMQKDDRVLLAVPLFHCFGQNALLNSVLNVGATIVLQQRFDLNETKQLIAEHQVTQLYGVPMMFGLLHDSCSPTDLQSITYCFTAAAKMPIQTGQAWREKFDMPIYEGYGLTETSPFASYNHRFCFEPGSIGMPIDGVEIKVVDTESNAECPTGELGEIVIRGPNVMLGYWNRPDDTAAAIRDGWFHSGDIGRIDDRGYLYVVDRVKDMIAVGGLKVFPAEVERVLLDHEAVKQAAVIGAPDQVFGEQVVAYLVLHDSEDDAASLQQIEQHAKQHLGNYKVPRRFIKIDELPRNPSGKVLKTKLREQIATEISIDSDLEPTLANLRPAQLADKLKSVHPSEQHRTTTQFLQQLILEIGEVDEQPGPDESFIEAGMDSLAIVGLSAQLQVEVGPATNLPPTLLFDYPRITDLAKFLVDTLRPTEKPEPGETLTKKVDSEFADTTKSGELKKEVEQMSEQEALQQLMNELQ